MLRPAAGGEREVPASGATVGEVLDDLTSRFPGARRTAPVRKRVRRRRGHPHARRARDAGSRGRHGDPAAGDGRRRAWLAASPLGLLDLVGAHAARRAPRLAPKSGVQIYAKLEGANPTGSIKDRVALAMIEAAEASGELEPGRALLEPTSGNTGISLAMVAKLKGYPLTCVHARERDGGAEAPAADLRRRRSSSRPRPRDRTAPSVSRSSWPSAIPALFMPFQYANEANPRAHYEGTGAEIAEALDRVDVLVAGLGTGGTLMGAGERLRETFPEVVVAAAEPLPGDPVMGLRSLEDGYVPPILDVSKLDRKILVSNAESLAGLRALVDREEIFAGVSSGAVIHVALPARRGARRGRRRLHPRRRRLEVPVGRLLGRARSGHGDGARPLVVVVPAATAPGTRGARGGGGAERSVRPAGAPRRSRRALRPLRQRRGQPVSVRPPAPDPALILDARGRRLRARRLPLAPDRFGPRPREPASRERRPLGGGPALPDPLARPTGELAGWGEIRGGAAEAAPPRASTRRPGARLGHPESPNIELSWGLQ